MLANKLEPVWGSCLEYCFYGLMCSLFFGNAVLSIFTVAFYILALPGFFSKGFFSKLFKAKPIVFLLGYFLILIFTTLLNSTEASEFIQIQTLLPFAVFPLAIFFTIRRYQHKNIIKQTFLIYTYTAVTTFWLSFGYGIFRVFFEESKMNIVFITYKHLASLFGVEPIYLSVLYLTSLVVITDHKGLISNKKLKSFFVLSLIIGIILLSSRTTLITLIIYGFYTLIKTGLIKKPKFIILIISIIVLGGLLSFSIPTLKERIIFSNKNISSYSGLDLRIKLWDNSLLVAKRSPIIGYGFKTSQVELQKHYEEVNFRRAFKNKFNSHNQYIQSFLDGGIIAFVALLIFLIYPILSIRNSTYSFFCLMLFIVLLTESFLSRQIGITFFCLFYTVFLIISMRDKPTEEII